MTVRTRSDQLPVIFLWHHHQPFYRAPDAVRPVMPWVRLHAVRGYRDMLAAARACGAKMTFNFSPSLLDQLNFAAECEIPDEFARVSLVPAREMSEADKRFVLTHFFSINWHNHVRPYPRFSALLAKRGEEVSDKTLRSALTEYSLQDYTDLVALFNLAWIGFDGRKQPEISELVQRSGAFTFSEIEQILDFHRSSVREIIPGYQALQESGQIEISTSPYAHSILPILCDSGIASPDIPRQTLPQIRYQYPDDAERHLNLAANIYQATWGCAPRGLWPSEGSVSDEALGLASKAGFKWAATDEAILHKSDAGPEPRANHFVSYECGGDGRTIRLYFRDHALSDAIGFRYSSMPVPDAVNEFVGHVTTIESGTRGTPGRCVVIALDGENPWEHYPDGGESFLSELFKAIEGNSRLTTLTVSVHREKETRERLRSVHPGSWIEGNFRIWIGDPEKNLAWTELYRARQVIAGLIAGDPCLDDAWAWLMKSQCSDWMWWYGEPFHSAYDSHFDELFRSYLKAVYAAAGRQHPPSLDFPITSERQVERRLQPAFAIRPVIDGRETSFFEWKGACRVDPRQYGVTMGRAEEVIRSFAYGFNECELVFRIDLAKRPHAPLPGELLFHIMGEKQHTFAVPLSESGYHADDDGFCWAYDEVIEVAVKHSRASVVRGNECEFWIEVRDGSGVVEKLPPSGTYSLRIPTDEEMAANWVI